MRIHPLIALLVALVVAGCDDSNAPPADGRLVVSTSTEGDDPDLDGYLLTIDELDTLALLPSSIVQRTVPAGQHSLRLLAVAERCSVGPGASLEVEVEPSLTTRVVFTIDCPATGVHITATTTGLDIAPDYRITVDDVDRGTVVANLKTFVRLGPGEQTIAVTDLPPNCSIEGPQSHTVTIRRSEVVPLAFQVVCTAASGVIGVVVTAEGIDTEGEYVASVSGGSHPVHPGQPTYLTGVAPGDHAVELSPPTNCSVETESQSVTVTAGGMVRDTAEVSFLVSCVERQGTLRIHATTSGTPPPHDYRVWGCQQPDFYCRFYAYDFGPVPTNGWLVVQIEPGLWDIWLEDVPTTCGVPGPYTLSISRSDTLTLPFVVSCP
jgi:hypothetical protein